MNFNSNDDFHTIINRKDRAQCDSATAVIDDRETSIEDKAFSECSNLISINISEINNISYKSDIN